MHGPSDVHVEFVWLCSAEFVWGSCKLGAPQVVGPFHVGLEPPHEERHPFGSVASMLSLLLTRPKTGAPQTFHSSLVCAGPLTPSPVMKDWSAQ